MGKKIYILSLLLISVITGIQAAIPPKFNWVKGTNDNSSNDVFVKSMVQDNQKNILITGTFTGTVDFDLDAGVQNLVSTNEYIFIAKYDSNGAFIWAKSIGNGQTVTCNSITVDVNDNIYITGKFKSIVDFDPNSGTLNLTTIASSHAFVASYTKNGTIRWANQIGVAATNSQNEGIKLIVDSMNRLFILGVADINADVDPGTSTVTITGGRALLVQWDTLANYIKAIRIGGLGAYNSSMCLDDNGNVNIIGGFTGTGDFDPSSSQLNLVATGTEFFVAKYDSSFSLLWAEKLFTADPFNDIIDICTDANSNLYINGQFQNPKDFDPGVGVSTVNPNTVGDPSMFILKLSGSGGYKWAKVIGGAPGAFINPTKIKLGSDGSLYSIGNFESTIDFNPGVNTMNVDGLLYDCFISCIDTNGVYQWVQTFSGPNLDRGSDLIVENDNSLLFTGTCPGGGDFDVSSDTVLLAAKMFLLKESYCTATLDNTVTVGATSLTANEANATYQWIDCNNGNANIVGATTQTFTPTIGGNYAVKLKRGACKVTTACSIWHPVGIDNINEVGINIYPNPVTNVLTIKVENQKEVLIITLKDMQGRIIMQKKFHENINFLDLTQQQAGSYILQIQGNQWGKFTKVKKEN